MSTRAPVEQPTPQVVKEIAGVPITSMSAAFQRDHPEMARGMEAYVKNLVEGKEQLIFDRGQAPPVTRKTKSLESLRLEQGARELQMQMEAQGWQAATVINLNPWAISVNGVLHHETLPACPSPAEWRQMGKSGKPYAYVTLSRYAQDTRDRGDGNWTCHPFVPMQLAQDYVEECKVTKWGGIFFYPGSYLPDTPHLPLEIKDRIEKEWNAAQKKLLAWARMMFNLADRAFNSPNGDKRIVGDMERRAAIWLLDNGYITQDRKPRWVDVTAEEAQLQKECPACHNKCDLQSLLCGNGRCTYVFDPRQAYVTGLVDDTHPALRRLTRAELDELDLQHVKSIAHLAGVAKAAPVVPVQDDVKKFADGELPETEEELTEEELEALTKPDQSVDVEAATPAPAPKGKKAKEPPKSQQQKKAEDSLE